MAQADFLSAHLKWGANMNSRVFLLTAFIAATCSLALVQEAENTTKSKRPNVLILIADDMGYSDIGAFGSEIQTPNIDSLAKGGISFTNFHVGGTCSPTRTMLISGVDNHLAGLGNMHEIMADNQFGKPGYEGYLNTTVVSIATVLKDAGYPLEQVLKNSKRAH